MSSLLARRVFRPKTWLNAKFLSTSRWAHVPEAPKDPILGVSEAFVADTDEKKVNVGVGAYRDDEGKPWVLPSVEEAQQRIVDKKLNMEYAPMGGEAKFVRLSLEMAYGSQSADLKSGNIAAVQSLSGTGALRLFGAFVERFSETKPTVYLPDPTWGNHFPIFQDAGLETATYRYYDKNTLGLDLDGLLEDLKTMPNNQVILLHACAHNPTGVDPTMEQWAQISDVCKEKEHIVVFDMAYQGFASGDPESDVSSVRHFVDEGHKIALCQSYAKNMGLYGQRVGCLSITCDNPAEKTAVEGQMKKILRAIYSNPPRHGARIAEEILADDDLKQQWHGEVKTMAHRIIDMRDALVSSLQAQGSVHDWSHITNQIGMFCFTGLTPAQCDQLTNEWHIYLTRNGRVSMAGVTSKNVDYLAEAIHAVTK